MTKRPLTLVDAGAAIRAGDLSSLELVQAAISRADALDGQLGVYLSRFDEQALDAAAAADEALGAGQDLGPLHGIPIAVKDILAASEADTTANSLVLDKSWGADKDAIVVERLRQAGAVITGKVTTMEFAIGLHDPDKPHPRPRNPWEPDAWPGGSSSGTAAGVAAGMFPAGIGTDTGGSIRIPAAYCGVCGLMPTYGRVPTAGCVPLGYSLDHIGPLARSARDCGVFLAAISGDDPRDPSAIPTTPIELQPGEDLTGVRVGVERANHLGLTYSDPALDATFEAAVEVLAGLGATVVEVEVPHYRETVTAQTLTMVTEALAYHLPDMQSRLDDFYRGTRAFVGSGILFSAADYVQAQRVRRVAQRRLAELFTQVDVIVSPTVATGAPPYEELDASGLTEHLVTILTQYWNAVGNPVLAVPMGFTDSGLPLSMQIAARPFEESMLIRVGESYQGTTDWHLRVPPLAEPA